MPVFRHDVAGDKSGVNLRRAPKAASTVIEENTFLTHDAAGRLVPCDDTSTYIVGISAERVTAADDNYTSTDEIVYDEPREGDLFIVDVDDAGTAGFVAGVERALNDVAGEVKAGALDGVDDVATVRVVKVLTATDQAIVTVKTASNRS